MSAIQNLVDFQEIDRFEQAVRDFLEGRMDPDRFMSFRLQHGVYGQRQEGVHMVRVKIPGGRLRPAQLAAIAEALERHSEHDRAHITTRQDIQLHFVPTERVPAVLRLLGEAGLTTREACNNTVRNVTACPLAGVCPREHVDITVHMIAAASRFLRYPLTQQMPRKFKISFSGCEADCAQGLMHDLAVVATRRDGRPGFRILAGGGLGHKPHHAITVEEFVEEHELLACMEAVLALHNRYSDRKRRARARIKFLVDRFGPEGFLERYREELARTRVAYAGYDHPRGEWVRPRADGEELPFPGAPRQVIPQKQEGLFVFPIAVPMGDLTAAQMRGIAALLEGEGLEDLRTTQDQNLMVVGVRQEQLERLRSGLRPLGLGEPRPGDNVVACPGTSTCRLGITASKAVGPKLSGGALDLRVRVSGCQNGCAQPETGDIGIYGEGRRLHGKLVPHYQMFLGGDGRGGGAIAFKGPSIPAMRVQEAVERVHQAYAGDRREGESFFAWSRRRGAGYFEELLADLRQVGPEEVTELARDHGQEGQFRVLQLGGGECAGAAQSLVAAQFAEAAHERTYRDAFRMQRQGADAVECAEQMLRLVARSVLFLAGREAGPEQPLEALAAALQEALEDGALGRALAELAQGLAAQRQAYDEAAFVALSRRMDAWMLEAAAVCQAIDSQLDLAASLPERPQTEQPPASEASQEALQEAPVIDLSGYGCPLHYIKARNALQRFGPGEVVEFVFAPGEASRQVRSSLESDGHQILQLREEAQGTRIRVRKAAQA